MFYVDNVVTYCIFSELFLSPDFFLYVTIYIGYILHKREPV